MTFPANPAPTAFPVHDLLAARWSPVAFDPAPLTQDEIHALFEAARWAPSSFNEQPWRYVYAAKGTEGRDVLESLLVEGNAWAKNASLLILSFVRTNFARNNKVNRHAFHDTGAASLSMALQATSMGLVSHQMAGFDVEKANAALGVPADFVPGSMIAIGRPGKREALPADQQQREASPRVRNPQERFAFRGRFSA
jgi:nitroreductase